MGLGGKGRVWLTAIADCASTVCPGQLQTDQHEIVKLSDEISPDPTTGSYETACACPRSHLSPDSTHFTVSKLQCPQVSAG